MQFRFPLIAFCGYGRSGKDQAAKTLISAGYHRVAFGDIIKGQLDSLIQEHFGFSAFTEESHQKARVRRTLESWGEDNYNAIFRDFFHALTPPAVNTRLFRAAEGREWVRRGGIVVWVRRFGIGPETPFAQSCIEELQDAGLIHSELHNMGDLEDLDSAVKRLYLDPATCFEHHGAY